MPPARPTVLRPAGTSVSLPKPVIIVDTRGQTGYTFARFRSWFSGVERGTLTMGDYSIAGLEDLIAVERKSLPDLFHSCAPSGGREIFVRACERLSTLDFAALVIEDSLEQLLDGHAWTDQHPNAVLGTLQALAVRWRIQPGFAGTPELAEEITASLLHKAYQLCNVAARGFPRQFLQGDI